MIYSLKQTTDVREECKSFTRIRARDNRRKCETGSSSLSLSLTPLCHEALTIYKMLRRISLFTLENKEEKEKKSSKRLRNFLEGEKIRWNDSKHKLWRWNNPFEMTTGMWVYSSDMLKNGWKISLEPDVLWWFAFFFSSSSAPVIPQSREGKHY